MSRWKGGSNFDAFYALESEKRTRIIKSALAEFASKGFKQGSTNTIAEKGQIGKGMLFYYFGSKEKLFDFLCQYTIEFMQNEFVDRFDTDSDDFLLRYKELSDIKKYAMSKYPEIFAFFESSFREENALYFTKCAAELEKVRQMVYDKMYGGIDCSLFREDIEGKAIVQYLKWLMDAYQMETMNRFKSGKIDLNDEQSLATEWSQFDSFTEDLRKAFYKEG